MYLEAVPEVTYIMYLYAGVQEVLQTDENWGLVQQVLQSQTRTNIKKLTKTFITLSLSDVASRSG